jgi:hypothetical protein
MDAMKNAGEGGGRVLVEPHLEACYTALLP